MELMIIYRSSRGTTPNVDFLEIDISYNPSTNEKTVELDMKIFRGLPKIEDIVLVFRKYIIYIFSSD